jgi:hypothetical protein
MSVITVIKFVGLLVTTHLTSPSGVQVIMGNFPPSLPPHTQLIAWPKGTRVPLPPNEEWPTNGEFTAKNGVLYEYSRVTIENVTITGPTEPFNLAMEKIPHLTCCCVPFRSGFNPQWGDPTYSGPGQKKSAFFTVTHGTYITVTESTGAISTALGITDNVDITFEGILGGSVRKIKVHPTGGNYILYVANTPLAVLEGKQPHGPDTDDFKSFYMMGNGTQGCTAQPDDPPPNACAPANQGCETNGPSTRKASGKIKKLVAEIRKKAQSVALMVDMNCSSSAWP